MKNHIIFQILRFCHTTCGRKNNPWLDGMLTDMRNATCRRKAPISLFTYVAVKITFRTIRDRQQSQVKQHSMSNSFRLHLSWGFVPVQTVTWDLKDELNMREHKWIIRHSCFLQCPARQTNGNGLSFLRARLKSNIHTSRQEKVEVAKWACEWWEREITVHYRRKKGGGMNACLGAIVG